MAGSFLVPAGLRSLPPRAPRPRPPPLASPSIPVSEVLQAESPIVAATGCMRVRAGVFMAVHGMPRRSMPVFRGPRFLSSRVCSARRAGGVSPMSEPRRQGVDAPRSPGTCRLEQSLPLGRCCRPNRRMWRSKPTNPDKPGREDRTGRSTPDLGNQGCRPGRITSGHRHQRDTGGA
jgi:hypothetical protein